MNTYADFMRGRFSGVSLTRDGRIVLAPRLTPLFSSDEPSIWTVAEGPGGALYVGTGHRGRLYRIDRTGASTLVWTAPEPEIFAVTVAPDGQSSPELRQAERSIAFAALWPKSISRQTPGTSGRWLSAATGLCTSGRAMRERSYRVTAKGSGEVWFETGQSHVTALAIDRNGRVLAGTDPNGLLYRLDAKDKAFVLYDATFRRFERLSLLPMEQSMRPLWEDRCNRGRMPPEPQHNPVQTPAVTAPTISITVTDEAPAQAPAELKPKTPEGAKACRCPRRCRSRSDGVYSAVGHRRDRCRQVRVISHSTRQHG